MDYLPTVCQQPDKGRIRLAALMVVGSLGLSFKIKKDLTCLLSNLVSLEASMHIW
jgi:hypothetical protein